MTRNTSYLPLMHFILLISALWACLPKESRPDPFIMYRFDDSVFNAAVYNKAKYMEMFVMANEQIIVCDDYKQNALVFIYMLPEMMSKKIPYPEADVQTGHYFIFHDDSLFYLLDGNSGNLYSLHKNDSVFQPVVGLNEQEWMQKQGLSVCQSSSTFYQLASISGDSLLIIPVLPNPEKKGTYSRYSHGFPSTVFFNLHTYSFHKGTVKYPDLFSKKNYGVSSGLYQIFDGDSSILYYTQVLPEVTKYNIFTQETKTIVIGSKYQTSPIPGLAYKRSPAKKDNDWRNYILTPRYGPMIYDAGSQRWYRIFFHELEDKKPNGEYTTPKDKNLSVMIMDKNLHIIDEIMLPKNASPFFMFANREGFHMMLTNEDRKYDGSMGMIKIPN